MTKHLVSIVAIVTLCLGCTIILPKSKIKGSIMGEPFSIISPQNQSLQGLEITAERNGNAYTDTNVSKVTIKVKSLQAVTDPNVVSATALGQAQVLAADAALISASADAIAKLGATAAAAMATGGASTVVPK